MLSKSSHIPLLARLSVISSYQREAWNELLSLDKLMARTTHSTHTHRHTHWSQQRKQNNARRSVPTAVWVSNCLSLPSMLHIRQMALSVYIRTVTQKDNSSVRAWGDYSIPPLFLLHSHANPGLLTLHSREITQTHKKNTKFTTHREHGKVSDHFKSEGRASTSWIVNLSQIPQHSL